MTRFPRLVVPLLVAAFAAFAVASAQGAKPPPPPPGQSPKLTLDPATATFGPVAPDNGDSQEFLLRLKDGTTSGGLTISIGGDERFAITADTCTGTAISPSHTCTVTVTYTPTGYDEISEGTLIATGKKGVKSASALLFGSSTEEPEEPPESLVSATPALLDFGQQTVGVFYQSKIITFTNNATEKVWLAGKGVVPSGFVDAGYSSWQACEDPMWGGLDPGKSCYGYFLFSPTAPGTYRGSFTTTWKNLAGETVSTTVFELEGHAYADLVDTSMDTLEFGSVTAGTVSDAQTVTLTNQSTDTLVLGSFGTYGYFLAAQTTENSCWVAGGVQIGPGGSCTLSVTFNPPSEDTETTPYSGWFDTSWEVAGSVPPPGEDPAVVAITRIPLSGTGIPANQAPTAADNSVEVDREVATTITLSGNDVNGDDLSFTIATTPAHGTLGDIAAPLCSGGSCTAEVTYTSELGYTGTDSFTFTTNDGALSSAAGTISITVPAPPNQEPWAEDVKDLQYSPPDGVTITLRGYDPDGDSLEFFIWDDPDYGSLDPIGTPSCDLGTSGGFAPMLAGSVCTAEVVYYPAAPEVWTGPVSFTYRVNDGSADSNTATVSFTGLPS